MRNIKTHRSRGNGFLCKSKKVVIYKDDMLYANCESHRHASNLIKVSDKKISRYVDTGKPIDGVYTIFTPANDPHCKVEIKNPEITPDQDQPVAMFDRDGDIILAQFKSVTQCAHALQRPIKTVLAWLNGSRCTDPDCYYKYVSQCTDRELKNQYKI